MGLLVVSIVAIRPMFLIVFGLLIVDIVVFVFNFMPYLAYNYRIKQIKKGSKNRSESINHKVLWKIDVFTGAMFLGLGILYLSERKYFAVFFIILGVFKIGSSLSCYKKYKKSL